MRFMNPSWPGIALLFLAVCAWGAQIPTPLSSHPGNIFLSGEDVQIRLPQTSGVRTWTLRDYDARPVTQIRSAGGVANLGELPVGYYIADDAFGTAITIGVLQRLKSPSPRESPVAVDTGMEYLYRRPEDWRIVASLTSLAGVSWVRDRFRWSDMEPQRGRFAPHPPEEEALQIWQDAGLQVLLMVSGSTPWSGAEPRRFPPDLRDLYDFLRNASHRWGDKIGAIEATNEGDVANTGSEIASYQKVAYLAIKEGDPNIIVCEQPWIAPEPGVAKDFRNNEVGPYFDVYSIHHYIPADKLDQMFEVYRGNANGKPEWVSEFNLTVPWRDERTKDPSPQDQRTQAERVAKMFAITLSKGVQRAFYFILSNYTEGPTQFGVLHDDFTPRPAYLALAAAGRLLAGAHTLGKLNGASARSDDQVYAFEAVPDGHEKEVLVAWASSGNSQITVPGPYDLYDVIGRKLPNVGPRLSLQYSPVFIVLARGSIANMLDSGRGLTNIAPPPPVMASRGAQNVSPIVLQALFKADQLVPGPSMELYSHHATGTSLIASPAGAPMNTLVFTYNFGPRDIQVRLDANVSNGWSYTIEPRVLNIPPHGRVPVSFQLVPHGESDRAYVTVVLHGRSTTASPAIVSWMVATN